MATPNNPFICHVAMIFNRDVREIVNTFHLFKAAGWTLPFMQQAATDAVSWWNLYAKQTNTANVSLDQVQIRLYDPANALAYDLAVSPPSPGTFGVPPVPANATLTMSWRTGRAGKSQRGRMYIPSIPSTQVNVNDTVSSTYLAQLATAAAQFVGPVWSNGVVPAIFHRLLNTYTPVNSYVLDATVDSQRRRLPGRGR